MAMRSARTANSFATSDFAPGGVSPNWQGIDIPIGMRLQNDEEPEHLYGIPYNRNRYAVLDTYNPNPGNFNGHYALNPAREGRDEPLVTILQSERTWPAGE